MSKRVGLSYGGTYQTLLALSRMKVFIRKKVGYYNIYRINPDSDLALGYLVSLAAQRKSELYSTRKLEGEALGRLTGRVKDELGPKLQSAILFGSFATGTNKKESDIDILFILGYDDDVKGSAKLISDLCSSKNMEAGRQINPVIVSNSEFKNMLKDAKRNLAHEVFVSGIPMIGSENYIAVLMEWLKWKGKSI